MKLRILPTSIFILVCFIFFSCKKNELPDQIPQAPPKFATTEKDKQTVATLTEVSTILKEVYNNPKAFHEIIATIYSGYYEDEKVLLKDLLFTEQSPIYKTEKFKSLRSPIGLFKKEFLKIYNKGDYPNLKKAFSISSSINYRTSEEVPNDPTQEIFSNSSGVSIYFPYSENYGTTFTPQYFDNINTDPFGSMATVIPADREANSAPGDEPYRYKTYDANGEIVWEIRYRPVTVNDDYAEANPTHIVGIGVTLIASHEPLPPSINTNRVFVGWGRINNRRQYDNLISFNSANGGGSEIKICRISGYLQFADQQVTSFAGDQAEVSYKRKEIKNGTWKRTYIVWDPDWVPGNTEQVMAIYEEDSQGTQTFNASLSTSIRRRNDSTIFTGSIGYSITVKTQDEIALESKFSRAAYFGGAKSDQGWGFQMCDSRSGSCRYDDTFLPTGEYWPKYNEGGNWNFTWPWKSY